MRIVFPLCVHMATVPPPCAAKRISAIHHFSPKARHARMHESAKHASISTKYPRFLHFSPSAKMTPRIMPKILSSIPAYE